MVQDHCRSITAVATPMGALLAAAKLLGRITVLWVPGPLGGCGCVRASGDVSCDSDQR